MTNKYLQQTEQFRSATGLPLSASEYVFTSSAACAIEELTEVADGLGDYIVTLSGIALQCTDIAVIDECVNEIETACQAAKLLKIDIDVVMDKIFNANMSKLCQAEEIAIETQTKYILEGVNSYIEPVGDYFAVYSDSAQTDNNGKDFPMGKLLKNVNWSEPDYYDLAEWFKNEDMRSIFTTDLVER